MNQQYDQLKVRAGEYIPQPALDYPQDNPFARTLFPKYTKEVTIDDKYPYLDDSITYKFNLLWGYYLVVHVLLRLKLRVQMGLRIHGREILKKHKEELKNGAITIANHIYRLDCPFPEAEAGMSAMKKFNEAFDEFHRRGWWFHIFPEACRWDFYKPLRPFQKGAFTMSYKYGMPLLPCVITYRERKGIFRLFGPKELPLLTVTIGELIYPNTSQPRKIEVERLRETAHTQMQQMAGITQNPWPAAWGNQ